MEEGWTGREKRPSAGRISRGRKSLVTGSPRALGQATPMFESFCQTRSIEYRGGSGFSMGDKSRTGEGWSRQSGVIYVSDSAPFFSFLFFSFLFFSFLSFPFLSFPFLSFPFLSFPFLSFPFFFALFSSFLSSSFFSGQQRRQSSRNNGEGSGAPCGLWAGASTVFLPPSRGHKPNQTRNGSAWLP